MFQLTTHKTTVQLNTVPDIEPVNEILVDVPEHIVSDVGVTTTSGIGFILTLTSTGSPEHPFAVAITV